MIECIELYQCACDGQAHIGGILPKGAPATTEELADDYVLKHGWVIVKSCINVVDDVYIQNHYCPKCAKEMGLLMKEGHHE